MECEKELFVGNLRTDVEPEFVQQKLIALFATVGVDVNADMIEVMGLVRGWMLSRHDRGNQLGALCGGGCYLDMIEVIS